jgi:hypothetical protein
MFEWTVTLRNLQKQIEYYLLGVFFFIIALPVSPCVKYLLLPYILKSNPHPFYSFRGLKNQMRMRIERGLDSRSRAGVWQNDRAGTCRTNNTRWQKRGAD